MAAQSLKDKNVEVESLHQHYLDLRENTLQMKRNGKECKAYHKWYDAAYVFFSSIRTLKESDEFNTFVSAKKMVTALFWNIFTTPLAPLIGF